MSLAILEVVVKTYPELPVLNACEWPYSRDELERLVGDAWNLLHSVTKPKPLRYWATMSGHVLRMPHMKPLIHNGRKPR